MQAWGAPQADIAALEARLAAQADAAKAAPTTFGVYPENMPTVQAFLGVRTQWVYVGMQGQRMGFNYAGVQSWLDNNVRRPARRKQIFQGLQVMELAVLQADQEQKQNEE